MALRSFAYDDPNYTLVRQHCSEVSDLASGVAFAQFRSRVKVIVNSIQAVCVSAASAAGSAVLSVMRYASATPASGTAITTFSFGAGTAGNTTLMSCAITLLSAGNLLAIVQGQSGGQYQLLYEYTVIAGESLYSNQ